MSVIRWLVLKISVLEGIFGRSRKAPKVYRARKSTFAKFGEGHPIKKNPYKDTQQGRDILVVCLCFCPFFFGGRPRV